MSGLKKQAIKSFIYLILFYISNSIPKNTGYLTNNINNKNYYYYSSSYQNNKLRINLEINDIEKDIFSNENETNKNDTTKLHLFNYIHISLSFLIIPICSIILIIYDLCEDKNLSKKYNLSKNEKANEEFKLLKKTNIAGGRYLFSWFLMKYKYPLTNIITIYNYDHQRYLRLIIVTIKFLFNILISFIIIFNFKKDILLFLSPFINTILVNIITKIIINNLLDHDKIRRNIFKPKLENLRKYAYYIIKKDILFNSKWHLIRNRMLSYYRICGQLILKKYKKNKYDKYERYVKNKKIIGNLSNTLHSFNSSFASNDEEKDSFENSSLNEKLLQNNNNNIKNISKIHAYKTEINNQQKFLVKKNNGYEKTNNLLITKGVESFSFSRYGVNNMKLKTLKKIEDIRNKYISNKNNNKYDETLDVDSYVKTFDNLDIEALENYTYISTDALINKLNKINSNSNKILLNAFTNIILILILFLLNLCLVFIHFHNLNKDKNDLKNYWIVITLTILADFLYYRVICLFISFCISKFYGYKKNKCINKLIFYLFFEKYITYLYRMRLLINKYNKEFNFIE